MASARAFAEKGANKAKGFVSIIQHKEPLEFIPYGDGDPTHGYFRIPESVMSERHMKNMIVNQASVFMAKRMRPGTSWGSGIGYLEIGTGVGSGSTQSPEPEDPAQTGLREPLVRKAITSWTCLDENGDPTAEDTNVLQFTTTFTEEEAVGALVEMGLFGGDADENIGTGMMFNYKVFPVINKDESMQLTIVWKVTF
jgi:hypothetical protein